MYGSSGTSPLHRPWVPPALPGAGIDPAANGMCGGWLLFLVTALNGRPPSADS